MMNDYNVSTPYFPKIGERNLSGSNCRQTNKPDHINELIKLVETCHTPHERGDLDRFFERCAGCPYKGQFGCVNILINDFLKEVKEIIRCTDHG